MAKTVKTKGSTLLLINNLLQKFPQEKVNEAGYKILNFFRAVKKPIRKYLDEVSELQKEARKTTEDQSLKLRILDVKLKGAKEEEKLEFQAQVDKLQKEIEKKLEPFNKQLAELNEIFTIQEFDAVFDNEDFNFCELIFKEKPVDFFGINGKDADGKEVKATDFETMSIVMDFFESAI